MSTKTTYKRIALVAVAALGFGVMTVAPSNAVPQADKLTLAATTASTTQGTAVSVNATLEFSQESSSDTMTLTLGFNSAPSGFSTGDVSFTNPATAVTTDLPASGLTADTSTATGSRVLTVSATGAGVFVKKTIAVTLGTSAKVGTYVIRVTPAIVGGGTPVSAAQTITFTVIGKTVGKSSAFIGVPGNGTTDTATADATISTSAAASTTPKARIDVGQIYGTTGNDTASAADALSVVVATDKGLVSRTTDFASAAKAVSIAAGVDGDSTYYFFSNGEVGKASITITVNGVLIATKNVALTGAATNLVAKLTTGQAEWVRVGGTTTYDITATDSEAQTVSNPTGLTVKSSDTSVATVVIGSNNLVTVTGFKAGTATITVTDPATTSAAAAVSFTATVAPVRPTSVDITFDAGSYNVGDLITMTISANMGDSATAQLFTAALATSASLNASGTALPTSGVHAIVGGKVVYKFFAPVISGNLTISGTTGGAVDVTTAAVISRVIAITNPGQDASVDAANEAVDAANAATDAAVAAAEAADAATDAVEALSETVTELVGAATDAANDATDAANAATDAATAATDAVDELSVLVTESFEASAEAVQAATDAAADATDAANAATDAALSAAEAADAATSAAQEASDAVAALSESVTKLITGLQTQIKSLAAVVAKIAKKVKA